MGVEIPLDDEGTPPYEDIENWDLHIINNRQNNIENFYRRNSIIRDYFGAI